jgi:hypothetical protein
MCAACAYSLALLTASKFGLSESIIERARELSKYCDAGTDDQSESEINLTHHAPTNNIIYALTILEETVEKNACIQIPPSYLSPPSLEGMSCVYILQIGDDKSKMKYYVGETNSLSRRLSEHRSKWPNLYAIAIKIDGGKSLARNVESLVIQRMAKSGFNLVNIADGISIRSYGRPSNKLH